MTLRATLLLALGGIACSSGDRPDPVDADAGDAGGLDASEAGPIDSGALDGDPDCTGAPFPTACGDDAITVAGDGAPVELPLSGFTYDAACNASVADVVTLRFDSSPSGLSITLDAGTVRTYLESALDGRRLVGLDERNEGTFREGGIEAQTIAWPDPSGAALAPGCLAVRPIVLTAAAGTVDARLFASARAETGSRLPIAVFPIDGIDLSPAELDGLMDILIADLATAGLDAFEVSREPVSRDGDTDISVEGERQELLAALEPSAGALSLVVAATLDSGLGTAIGIAGGIPGPALAGTAGSGVVLAIEPARAAGIVNLDVVAQIATHEIGHQLGLFHVVEASGLQADLLDDTDDCPRADYDGNGDGTLSVGECPPSVAFNRMFWAAADPARQVELSDGQKQALAHAVLVSD